MLETQDLVDGLIFGVALVLVAASAYAVSRSGYELVWITPVSIGFEIGSAFLGFAGGSALVVGAASALALSRANVSSTASWAAGAAAGILVLVALSGPLVRRWRADVDRVDRKRQARRAS